MAQRKNFTEREKALLVSIVGHNKDVIENKGTNSVFVSQKNEIWDSIKNEYNAQAETPRTVKQLHTLYFNMKRTTRQHVANENIKKYSKKKEDIQQMENETEKEIKDLKKDAASDKKGITATGGGSYKQALTDAGAQMLALIGDQIKPLENACDSATEYYEICNENKEVFITEEVAVFPPDAVETAERSCVKHLKRQGNTPRRKTRKILLKKKSRSVTCEQLKRKVYREKLESAMIEKQTKLLEHKIMSKKQRLLDIEIKIKQVELEKIQK